MSSIAPIGQNPPLKQGLWQSIAPNTTPILAASAAIIPVFRELVAKSALQQGLPLPRIKIAEGLKMGALAAPNLGLIIGVQMTIQKRIETALAKQLNISGLPLTLASSAVVGFISSPILAVFNGTTMGWSVKRTLRKFTPKQGLAIMAQETAFIGGLNAADLLAKRMKPIVGDNKLVDYAAAFSAGLISSLAAHPANTAVTRLQNDLKVHPHQLMWGASRRAPAMGLFSVLYKAGNEFLNPK